MLDDKRNVIYGMVCILLGLFLGIFLGGYCLFIGGLEQAINGFSAQPINSSDVAWGIGRILMSAFALGICTLFGFIGGIHFFNDR